MYCYYAPDERRERGGLEMVLMVKSPLCARVSVHFKKAYFAYFVAYIAHSSVSVIGDIYANICANIWLIRYRQNTTIRIVWFGVSLDVLSLAKVSLPLPAAFRFPWAGWGGGEGGGGGRGGRGVCCWGCGVCEGRYPSDALWVKKCFWSPAGIFFALLRCRYTLKHASWTGICVPVTAVTGV